MPQKISHNLAEYANALSAVDVKRLNSAISYIRATTHIDRTVYTAGNGGSASTATHFAADLNKYANGTRVLKRIRSTSLVENVPLLSAIINDEGWSELFTYQLNGKVIPGDILCCFSVHGGVGEESAGAWSQNLVRAIDYVNDNNGITIGFSGFNGGVFENKCSVNIVEDTTIKT